MDLENILEYNIKVNNMIKLVDEEVYTMELNTLPPETLEQVRELIGEGNIEKLVDFFNGQDFPTLYKEQIKETLEEGQDFPTIFSFQLGQDFALTFIRATETSERYKEGKLYLLTIDRMTKILYVTPTEDLGKEQNVEDLFNSLSAMKESFPVLFSVEGMTDEELVLEILEEDE